MVGDQWFDHGRALLFQFGGFSQATLSTEDLIITDLFCPRHLACFSICLAFHRLMHTFLLTFLT